VVGVVTASFLMKEGEVTTFEWLTVLLGVAALAIQAFDTLRKRKE